MLVVFDGIADVKAAATVNLVEQIGLVERYSVDYLTRGVLWRPTSLLVPKSSTPRVQNTGFWLPGP